MQYHHRLPFPRDGEPLTYGLLVTGKWIAATEHTYNLSGQILIHDLMIPWKR